MVRKTIKGMPAKEYYKTYREANKEKIAEHKKAYYEAKKEKIAEYYKARYQIAKMRQQIQEQLSPEELLGQVITKMRKLPKISINELQALNNIGRMMLCMFFNLEDYTDLEQNQEEIIQQKEAELMGYA